jgi:N-acetylated-alpha-linked acidic dipeptidase
LSGKSLWQMNRERQTEQARTEEAKKDLARPDLRIGALGSGSDYTPFLQHLGVASANIGFGGAGDGGGGVYHSIYDTFAWYTRFSDTDFAYGRTLAQTGGTVVLRLAQADVLPFEFTNVAETVGRYVDEVEKLGKDAKLDFTPLRSGLETLKKSAAAYESALQKATPDQAASADLDRALIRTERALMGNGLPRRNWYRHRLYAPGFYTGYDVKTLPGVREAIEQKQWDEARAQIVETAAAFTALATEIDRATGILSGH